jgi:putative endonuclease
MAGIACRTTAFDAPRRLEHLERFPTFSESRSRESQLKRWSAAKKEALIRGDVAELKLLARSRRRDRRA